MNRNIFLNVTYKTEKNEIARRIPKILLPITIQNETTANSNIIESSPNCVEQKFMQKVIHLHA